MSEQKKKIEREKFLAEVEVEDKSYVCKNPFVIKLECYQPETVENIAVDLKVEPDLHEGAELQSCLIFLILQTSFCNYD